MAAFRGVMALAAAAMLAWAGVAKASGDGAPAPWYLDEFGGDRADLLAHWSGRTGVVMANAPASMLFIDWRLLHGKSVGEGAGQALSLPCCGAGSWTLWGVVDDWLKTLDAVTGQATSEPLRVETERRLASYETEPNCFDEAFRLAAQTLTDRAQRYGAASPAVQAWAAGQTAVFQACSDAKAQMPAPLADAPPWLVFDRHYQEAALALYAGRNREAAQRFLAIDREAVSPWRYSSLYLAARAEVREALGSAEPAAYARAQGAIDRLAAAPQGTFGQGEVVRLRNTLAFHRRPDAFYAQLVQSLGAAQIGPTAEADFKDFVMLGTAKPPPPDVVDWITTLKARARPANATGGAAAPDSETDAQGGAEAAAEAARAAALKHALDLWRRTNDRAWLIAALSLAGPGDPAAQALAQAAGAVAQTDPAWLTAQYHALRLALGAEPAAPLRRRLDAILARPDLSVSDRNLFEAQRTQVAANLPDFLHVALRRRLCEDVDLALYGQDPAPPVRCVRWRWERDAQPAGIYDGEGSKGATGFGEDARAIIDRMPLALRLEVSADPSVPEKLRLDVALTSYGRAVGAQDDARIDEASRQLIGLLPLMADDFRSVLAARPGPDKRFAEFLVLAKDPGVRADLSSHYVRPEGRRVADFQSSWADWILLPQPTAANPPPRFADYGLFGFQGGWDSAGDGAVADLTCLGECGRAPTPMRLPDFVNARQASADAERAKFLVLEESYSVPPRDYPPAGVAVWDEMLAWCESHPADPRVPEALHWLVHVGHFGGSHNHSGRRAFRLLHARYPKSQWARNTPYYND